MQGEHHWQWDHNHNHRSNETIMWRRWRDSSLLNLVYLMMRYDGETMTYPYECMARYMKLDHVARGTSHYTTSIINNIIDCLSSTSQHLTWHVITSHHNPQVMLRLTMLIRSQQPSVIQRHWPLHASIISLVWCDVMWCGMVWCVVMWCVVMIKCCFTFLSCGY